MTGFNQVGVYNSNSFSVKSTGATLLFTTAPATFAPMMIGIYSPSVNSITVPATLSIGTNSPNYNNIITATQLNALTSGNYYVFNITGTLAPIPANTAIYANVTIAATGTSQNVRVFIMGQHQ